MIYTLAGWERLNPKNPWLLTSGNTVVKQDPRFASSQESLIIAGFLVTIPALFLLLPFFLKEVPWTFESLSGENLIQILMILGGGAIAAKSKEGMRIRTESGGIHPEDSLFVFDANKKILSKQKGTAEEILANFENLTFEIRAHRHKSSVDYVIYAHCPQEKIRLAKNHTKNTAEETLRSIKSRLHIA